MDSPENHGFVYWLYAEDDSLLYIGSTINVKRRMTQHKSIQPWWPQVAVLKTKTEAYPTVEAARAAETRAIIAERPRHNDSHNRPARQQPARQLVEPGLTIFASPDGRLPAGVRYEHTLGGLHKYSYGTKTIVMGEHPTESHSLWVCLAHALKEDFYWMWRCSATR